ncbi:MAG TPA: hypothetical protein VGF90_07780 [Verrucomicrobiae bacterium]
MTCTNCSGGSHTGKYKFFSDEQMMGVRRREQNKTAKFSDPAPIAPKWFAAVEMIRLAGDQDWLHKGRQGDFQKLAQQAWATAIRAAHQ